jgi:hypothetical protein
MLKKPIMELSEGVGKEIKLVFISVGFFIVAHYKNS